jgi:hypothetical protein
MRGLTHLMVVGADERDAWATLKNLAAELRQMPPHYSVGTGGFTQFVSNFEGEPFSALSRVLIALGFAKWKHFLGDPIEEFFCFIQNFHEGFMFYTEFAVLAKTG